MIKYAFMESLDDFKIYFDKDECIKVYNEINTMIWKEFEEKYYSWLNVENKKASENMKITYIIKSILELKGVL